MEYFACLLTLTCACGNIKREDNGRIDKRSIIRITVLKKYTKAFLVCIYVSSDR